MYRMYVPYVCTVCIYRMYVCMYVTSICSYVCIYVCMYVCIYDCKLYACKLDDCMIV